MRKHHPKNERIKREYFIYLKEAMRASEATVDATAKALSRFEEFTRYQGFKSFHHHQAVAFKKQLADQNGQRSGKKLSKATLHSTLTALKRFFHWLAGQQGYKRSLSYSDAQYFNLAEKEVRVARAQRPTRSPTLEQVRHVIATMPAETDIERRDRALIAFTLLTGARDGAITSLKLKHVDLTSNSVFQDAREVKTKFSKTFTSHFLPVGYEVKQIVIEWVEYLRKEKLWSNDDPLFPATRVAPNKSFRFEAVGLKREHWKTAAAIQRIFKEAFLAAGLPYFNPHSFRNTLAQLCLSTCQGGEELKVWSQSLGHEKVLTTLISYGEVPSYRQGDVMRDIWRRTEEA